MTPRPFSDPELSALAGAIGLRHAQSPEQWRNNALARLGKPRFEQLQAWRAALFNNPASEAGFYDFVTADADLILAMLEGRLGYYDAVLPRVTELLNGIPHARILDLGSYGGLVSLYLARHWPDSQVVGIDRSGGAVERANELLDVVQLGNVEFVPGDYNFYAPDSPFDVVVSLQTVPTYYLEQIPSESPEDFQRGSNLAAACCDPTAPSRHVAQALASVRRLAGERGRVVLHERLPDVARGVLFLYLTNSVGLGVERMELVRWQTANEREGVQQAPLLFAAPHAEPAPFDESPMIDRLLPQPAPIDVSRLGSEQPAALTGAEAQWSFQALAGPREEVCVQGVFKDRHRFHIHLGIVGGSRAYVYTCTTSDYRELKICEARFASMLFTPVAEQLLFKQNSGEIFQIDPDPRALDGILREKFGW